MQSQNESKFKSSIRANNAATIRTDSSVSDTAKVSETKTGGGDKRSEDGARGVCSRLKRLRLLRRTCQTGQRQYEEVDCGLREGLIYL